MNAREMTPRDRPFVACTWARSARYRLNVRERFRLVNRMLDTSAVLVLGGDHAVHAWAAGDRVTRVLHYVYVPPELRGEGIARQAITALFSDYADHITVSHPWPRSSRRFRYSPDALLRSEVTA